MRMIFRSGLTLIISVFAGSIVVFGLLRMLGGDVAYIILGQGATAAAVETLRAEFGLDQPWIVQYVTWIRGVVVGDLGTSYAVKFDIFDQIVTRMGPTTMLAIGSLLISYPLALFLGIYSAMHARQRRGTYLDVGAQIGIAIPAFWAGLILVLVFAVNLGWFPATGYVPFFEDPLASIRSLTLPIIALSMGITAMMMRYVRSAMIDVMNEDYIRTARAKGRTMHRAVIVHGVRNAAIPLVTVGALQLGALLAGTVVIENVFVIPGLGRMLLVAVNGREVVVVQSVVLVILIMILILNFLLDISYGLLDPRVADKQRGADVG
jgi:peptide/nickel transport system permease protein